MTDAICMSPQRRSCRGRRPHGAGDPQPQRAPRQGDGGHDGQPAGRRRSARPPEHDGRPRRVDGHHQSTHNEATRRSAFTCSFTSSAERQSSSEQAQRGDTTVSVHLQLYFQRRATVIIRARTTRRHDGQRSLAALLPAQSDSHHQSTHNEATRRSAFTCSFTSSAERQSPSEHAQRGDTTVSVHLQLYFQRRASVTIRARTTRRHDGQRSLAALLPAQSDGQNYPSLDLRRVAKPARVTPPPFSSCHCAALSQSVCCALPVIVPPSPCFLSSLLPAPCQRVYLVGRYPPRYPVISPAVSLVCQSRHPACVQRHCVMWCGAVVEHTPAGSFAVASADP